MELSGGDVVRFMMMRCQESGSRVVFGKKRHSRPPPMSRAATINVDAPHHVSSNWAIAILPIIPPNLAATMDIAMPVARKLVGKTSVIRQSSAALPQLITPLKNADTRRLWSLL